MSRIGGIIIIILFTIYSCKGTKSITTTNVKKQKAEKVISNHYKNSFDYTTISARIKLKYDAAKQSFSPSVSLRLEKDKKIWVSAKVLGITVAKALITPDKVSYYEKMNGTYFEGNFDMLSKWLGADLDYQKVQDLLLGQAIFDLRKDKYQSSVIDQKYKLIPKKELELFERLFLINPDNYKIGTQLLEQPSNQKSLKIDYESYQKVGGQDFPKEIRIEAVDVDQKTILKIEYRVVDYNAKVNFPFKIPSGYQQVIIQ